MDWVGKPSDTIINPSQDQARSGSVNNIYWQNIRENSQLTAFDGSYQFCVLSDQSTEIGSYKDNWSNILSQIVAGDIVIWLFLTRLK